MRKFTRPRAAAAAGRAGRPDRPAAVPRLRRVALRDRARAARRRRLHGVTRRRSPNVDRAARSGRPRAGETFEKLAPATGEAAQRASRARDAGRRRRGGEPPPRRAARLGRAHRRRSAGGSCAGSPSCSSATATRSRRSSPPRPARRRRRRAGETGRRDRAGLLRRRRGPALLRPDDDRARSPNRQAMTIRQPLGVAGLIIAANTPIANVAWKVFPALLCGNAAVLKASEDTPETALAFARLAAEAGLPAGRAQRRPGLRRGGGPAARRAPATSPSSASPARPRSAG